MSDHDAAVRGLIAGVLFDDTFGGTSDPTLTAMHEQVCFDQSKDITAALRSAGMLRTPGTEEVCRIDVEDCVSMANRLFEIEDSRGHDDRASAFAELADRLDAVLAAGAYDEK